MEADGNRRKFGRPFWALSSQAPCLTVMETCGGAHYWGREFQKLGHEVRLIAPVHVKAFVTSTSPNDMSAEREPNSSRTASAFTDAALAWCRCRIANTILARPVRFASNRVPTDNFDGCLGRSGP